MTILWCAPPNAASRHDGGAACSLFLQSPLPWTPSTDAATDWMHERMKAILMLAEKADAGRQARQAGRQGSLQPNSLLSTPAAPFRGVLHCYLPMPHITGSNTSFFTCLLTAGGIASSCACGIVSSCRRGGGGRRRWWGEDGEGEDADSMQSACSTGWRRVQQRSAECCATDWKGGTT